jgi:hypothetical protein
MRVIGRRRCCGAVLAMVAAPYATKSDSFYFVDGEIVMHNKAEYRYTDDSGVLTRTTTRAAAAARSRRRRPVAAAAAGSGGGIDAHARRRCRKGGGRG